MESLKLMIQEDMRLSEKSRVERTRLRDAYDREVDEHKYRYDLKRRVNKKEIGLVNDECQKYAEEIIWMSTSDEVVYNYQRELQRQLQWNMLKKQYFCLPFAGAIYAFSRRMQRKRASDILYFVIPYAYVNYGAYLTLSGNMFEVAFPAHPEILRRRKAVLNKCCFQYP